MNPLGVRRQFYIHVYGRQANKPQNQVSRFDLDDFNQVKKNFEKLYETLKLVECVVNGNSKR